MLFIFLLKFSKIVCFFKIQFKSHVRLVSPTPRGHSFLHTQGSLFGSGGPMAWVGWTSLNSSVPFRAARSSAQGFHRGGHTLEEARAGRSQGERGNLSCF